MLAESAFTGCTDSQYPGLACVNLRLHSGHAELQCAAKHMERQADDSSGAKPKDVSAHKSNQSCSCRRHDFAFARICAAVRWSEATTEAIKLPGFSPEMHM